MNLNVAIIFIKELLAGTEDRQMYSTAVATVGSMVASATIAVVLGYQAIMGIVTFYGIVVAAIMLYMVAVIAKEELIKLRGAVKDSYETATEDERTRSSQR